MKRVFVLLSALVLVAGCSDSDTAPAANDDNRAQFTANLLSANEVPIFQNPAEAGASGTAHIDFHLTKDAAGTITAATVDFRVDLAGLPATSAITLRTYPPGAAGVSGPVLVTADVAAGQVTLTNGSGTFTRINLPITPVRQRPGHHQQPGRASTSTCTSSCEPGRRDSWATREELDVAGTRFLTGVAAVFIAAAAPLAGQVTNPVPPAAKSIAAGAQLYQKYCKACHGEDATGDGPLAPKDVHPPNLRDAEWKYGATDGEIFTQHQQRHRPQVRHEGDEEPDDRHRHLERRQLPAQHRRSPAPSPSP